MEGVSSDEVNGVQGRELENLAVAGERRILARESDEAKIGSEDGDECRRMRWREW